VSAASPRCLVLVLCRTNIGLECGGDQTPASPLDEVPGRVAASPIGGSEGEVGNDASCSGNGEVSRSQRRRLLPPTVRLQPCGLPASVPSHLAPARSRALGAGHAMPEQAQVRQ
jgi:hypothetical protein